MPEDDPVTATTSSVAAINEHSTSSAFHSRGLGPESLPHPNQSLQTSPQDSSVSQPRYHSTSTANHPYPYHKPEFPSGTSQQAAHRFPLHRPSVQTSPLDQNNRIAASIPAGAYQASEGSPYLAQPGYYTTPGPNIPYSSSEQQDIMATAHMRPHTALYHPSQPMSQTHPSQDMGARGMYQQPGYNPNMYLPQYGQPSQPHPYQYQNLNHGQYSPMHAARPSYAVPSQHGIQSPVSGIDTTPGMVPVHVSQRSEYGQMSPTMNMSSRSPTSVPPIQSNFNGSQSNAAPGPIPATTPLVVKHDDKGVKHIEFEYSRDRIKTSHNIRCDVDTVDVDSLPQKFKEENCVYPRACGPKESYTGNRYAYETECNEIGWKLAWLNQPLQGRRGLIQRAVDSWRNSNADPKMRSRRVRRLAKNQKRNQQQHQNVSRLTTGDIKDNRSALPTQRHSLTSLDTSPYAHPMYTGSRSQHSGSSASANGEPFQSPSQTSATADYTLINRVPPYELHSMHDCSPSFPSQSQAAATHSLPPMGDQQFSSPVAANATLATASTASLSHSNEPSLENLPDDVSRSYTLSVKDTERQTNHRVNFDIDDVDIGKIEESYRIKTAVWPRSLTSRNHLPVINDWTLPGSTQSAYWSSPDRHGPNIVQDRNRSDTQAFISNSPEDRQIKEQVLNHISSHIAHVKPRIFDQRLLLLQRTVDTCRTQISKELQGEGYEPPSFLKRRTGREIWTNRSRFTN